MTSQETVRHVLRTIVARQCCPLWDSSETYERALGERCPDHAREIALIVLALQNGIVSEMFRLRNRLILSILLPKLIRWLARQSDLAQYEAKWAVESWAIALGLLPFEDEDLGDQTLPVE